jgi:hypothetical protein
LLEKRKGTWAINKGRLRLREENFRVFRDDEEDECSRNTDGKEELLGGDAAIVAVAVPFTETAPEFMFISLLCASRRISGGKGTSVERLCMLLLLLLLDGIRSCCAMVALTTSVSD